MKKDTKLLPIIVGFILILEYVIFFFLKSYFELSMRNVEFITSFLLIVAATVSYLFLTISQIVKKEKVKKAFKVLSNIMRYYTYFVLALTMIYYIVLFTR